MLTIENIQNTIIDTQSKTVDQNRIFEQTVAVSLMRINILKLSAGA